MEPDPKYYDWLKLKAEDMAGGCDDGNVAACLRNAPHVFTVLLGLLQDETVPKNVQQAAAAVLCYFLLPTDFIPEAFLGIMGLKDDLFLAALYLDSVRKAGYAENAARHWRGEGSMYDCVDMTLKAESNFVTPDVAAAMRQALKQKLAD